MAKPKATTISVEIILTTSRLTLRPFKLSDFEAYHTILAHKEVGDWLGRYGGFDIDQTKFALEWHVRHWKEHGYGPWAVFLKEEGKMIGHCGLKYKPEFQATELLYAIDHDLWGKGFATEASREVLKFGFDMLKLKRIICFTLSTNLASQGVMKKLGFSFTHEGMHADLPHVFYELKRPA